MDAHSRFGHGRYKSLAPEELLGQMDENGIDRTTIWPIEEQITVHNQEGNDFILAHTRLYPSCFIGFAVANP